MAIQLNQLHAASAHEFQRTELLRVGGREYSREALRARVESIAETPPVTLPNTQATSVPAGDWDEAGWRNIDAATRLRALVLSAFTGQPLALAGDSPAAGREAQTGGTLNALKNVGAPTSGNGNDANGEPVPPLLAGMKLDNALLVIDEWEASLVAFSVDLSIDGRQILGELRVQQSRTHHLEISATAVGIQKFLDPLVLNFNGPLVLAEGRVHFDLDVDGQAELLPRITSDSYLLAWDKNGNGRIDDGSEVVGALSGNGYADLRALDDNGDGFLSKADAGFQLLRLWRPGEQGIGQSLDARAIQAIYLSSIDSPFTLQASDNGDVLGRVRQSSFFVADNSVRLSQQVDFWV